MLILYQQKIFCDSSPGESGQTSLSNDSGRSRFGSQNQTLYIDNEWERTRTASDVLDRLNSKLRKDENSFGVSDVLLKLFDSNFVQKAIHSIVDIRHEFPNQLVSKGFTADRIAQNITNAKLNLETPTNRQKLSGKHRPNNGSTSKTEILDKSSPNEQNFQAFIQEINRIHDGQHTDASTTSSKTDQHEHSTQPDEHRTIPLQRLTQPNATDSVVIQTDFDPVKNKTVLTSIYLPTYENFTLFSGVSIGPKIDGDNRHDEFTDFVKNDLDVDEEKDHALARSLETFTKNHAVNVDLYKLYETITGVSKTKDVQTGIQFNSIYSWDNGTSQS